MCLFNWILINAFRIRLRFVKYRFVRHRFVRYWSRFVSRSWLDTDIPSKHFVWLQDVLKTSWRHILKTSLRHVFKTSPRPLQRNNFSSFKTSKNILKIHLEGVLKTSRKAYLQDVFKTSCKMKSCYAEDALKTSWRHVLKTSSRLLEGQQMFAGKYCLKSKIKKTKSKWWGFTTNATIRRW